MRGLCSIVCPALRRNRSTHDTGIDFEKQTIRTLERLCFRLRHTGGQGDQGVDFRGEWQLSHLAFKIVGQCKCERLKLGARPIRELEGVIQHEPPCTIGIMATPKGYTSHGLRHFRLSQTPLIMCVVSQEVLVSFFINDSAGKLIPGLQVGYRLQNPSLSRNAPSVFYNGELLSEIK